MSTRTKALKFGSLTRRTGFHVRLAQIKIFKNFEALMAELDLTPPVYSVLEILHLNPGITPTQLADAILLDRSSVVPLIDKLVARGVIAREISTTDRRVKHLALTAQGHALLALAAERVEAHEKNLARLFTAAEHKTLLSLIERIHQAL